MKASMLIGVALGVAAGAILASSSTQVSDAVMRGRSDFDRKWRKFKTIMR